MKLQQAVHLFFLTVFVSISGLMCTRDTDNGEKSSNGNGQHEINNVKRVGMVTGIKPEMIKEYKRLHADSYPGVRDLLTKYNMHNFSIYLSQIEDKWYEFGYYEYTGGNFERDMANLALEPRNIEWLKVADPMQTPLSGSTGWTEMERVYYNK